MNADNQFNLKVRKTSKGGQESASEKYRGGREFKTKMAHKAAGKDYGSDAGHIHVPRKFARRHARGVSFNSTGKGLNEREEESPSAHRQVNSLIYDKATLEAEKEKERRKQLAQRTQPEEQSEPLLTNNEQEQLLEDHLASRTGARPNTKQVTFRNAHGTRMNPRSRAQNNIAFIRPAHMNQTYGPLSEAKQLNARLHEQTQSGTLSHQPSQVPLA